jgi:hypothetical protein
MRRKRIISRRMTLRGILLGTLAVASCGEGLPAPSPVPERPPSVSPGPPSPVPPPNSGGNVNAASGLYGLTLTIGSQCTAVPEAEKIRRYTARLDDDGPGRYVVTLSDATFLTGLVCTLSGLGCHQFRVVEEAETIRFSLGNNDDWHGGYITEQTKSGTWLAITGDAIGARHASSIQASGRTDSWYCATPSGYPYPCSAIAFCTSDLRRVFTKK